MQIAAPVPRPVRRLLPAGGVAARPILLIVLALGIVAGAGIVAYQRFFAPAAPAPTGQVIPVQRGNVAATVSATGSVVATRQAKLVFSASGRIQEIMVNVGDHVEVARVRRQRDSHLDHTVRAVTAVGGQTGGGEHAQHRGVLQQSVSTELPEST